MKFIKDRFSNKQFRLIEEILKNGRNQSWLALAKKFDIKPEGSEIQRTKAANDIWRRFNRIINQQDLNLETVKQVLNGKGQILFETRKKQVDSKIIDTRNYQVDKVTTSPYGGQWITYKKQEDNKNIILPAVEKLLGLLKNKEDLEFEDLAYSKTEVTQGRYIAVVNFYDLHLDKLPVKSTCGVESTLQDNINIFKDAVTQVAEYLRGQINGMEKIILPLGNDLFHTNGFNSQTKKGTQIEYLCQPEEAYYTICETVTWMVKILSTILPVKVLMIKGNHDEDKITTLGFWLSKYFEDDENVDIDFTRRQRKYFKFGKNLLGFAHGDKEKSKISQLPLIMATEAKEYWGKTDNRKFYLGDLHHGFEYQFLKAKDMPGVEVEYLRSCGTTDTWHEDFGYIGIPKTAYVQFFEYEEGEVTRTKFPIRNNMYDE